MRLMPSELSPKIFKGTYHKVEGFHVLRLLKLLQGSLQRTISISIKGLIKVRKHLLSVFPSLYLFLCFPDVTKSLTTLPSKN